MWFQGRGRASRLDFLSPFSEGQTLTVTGLLATKLHAILEQGARRDFFDVYVLLWSFLLLWLFLSACELRLRAFSVTHGGVAGQEPDEAPRQHDLEVVLSLHMGN